ncbi:hypothetical protein ANN_03097 [Periplaneta americana]|uniref:Uncharacterized protein n=1 Tax=Periplaneta americana TaxID=6978 RepID=A0ABQ8TZA3_PERAM|nr:hypothetical protein ANN_03097 [Periplaneta americana]
MSGIAERWLFNDAVSTTRLFSVDEIGDSEMEFGEMRPRIRRRLPGIHLMVGENLGKNPTSLSEFCNTVFYLHNLHSHTVYRSPGYICGFSRYIIPNAIEIKRKQIFDIFDINFENINLKQFVKNMKEKKTFQFANLRMYFVVHCNAGNETEELEPCMYKDFDWRNVIFFDYVIVSNSNDVPALVYRMDGFVGRLNRSLSLSVRVSQSYAGSSQSVERYFPAPIVALCYSLPRASRFANSHKCYDLNIITRLRDFGPDTEVQLQYRIAMYLLQDTFSVSQTTKSVYTDVKLLHNILKEYVFLIVIDSKRFLLIIHIASITTFIECKKIERRIFYLTTLATAEVISVAAVSEFCPAGVLLHASKSTDMSLST